MTKNYEHKRLKFFSTELNITLHFAPPSEQSIHTAARKEPAGYNNPSYQEDPYNYPYYRPLLPGRPPHNGQ